MTPADIQELERLISVVRRAEDKRLCRETHEASLLEFMCAETRLVQWLRGHSEELLEIAKASASIRSHDCDPHKCCQHRDLQT